MDTKAQEQTLAFESALSMREAAALQFLTNISLTGVPDRPLAVLTNANSCTARNSTEFCAGFYGPHNSRGCETTTASSYQRHVTIPNGRSTDAAQANNSKGFNGRQQTRHGVGGDTAVYTSAHTVSAGSDLAGDSMASQSVLALQFLNNISLGSQDGDSQVQREYNCLTGSQWVTCDNLESPDGQGERAGCYDSDGSNDGISLQSANQMDSSEFGAVERGTKSLEPIAERGGLRRKSKVMSGKFGSRHWLSSNSENQSNGTESHTASRHKGRALKQLYSRLHAENGLRGASHRYSQGDTPTNGEMAGSLHGLRRGSLAERASVDTHQSRSFSISETRQGNVQMTGKGVPLISHHRERLDLATSHPSKTQKLPATSYHFLLEPSWGEPADPRERTGIDDPTIKSGKHRTVLTLQSLMVSVIQYAEPNELKRDLNEQFRERNADVHITLSKLRSLKQQMLDMALNKCSLDLATLALSYIYFERLVVKGVVVKQNRRLLAGVSLLLAAKFYNQNVSTAFLCHVIDVIEEELHVSCKEIRGCEFSTFAHLNFGLHVEQDVFMTMFQRVRLTVPDYKKPLFDPLAIACHGPITSSPSL